MGASIKGKHLSINIIKSQMALKGDTYEKLAQVLGKSKGTIHSKLSGKRKFTPDELGILSVHYGVPIDYFFT